MQLDSPPPATQPGKTKKQEKKEEDTPNGEETKF
jgi:hypothetical protein